MNFFWMRKALSFSGGVGGEERTKMTPKKYVCTFQKTLFFEKFLFVYYFF
jgi:hypothetical protein